MEPLRRHDGIAVPLRRANVDTDAIAPMRFLVSPDRQGLGRALFANWRAEDPDFPLNRARWAGASVLVAGANFGCGSSREMAVWALAEAGFRVIIAPSFGEIFAINCFKNGLLAIALPEAAVEALQDALEKGAGQSRMSVDLEANLLVGPDGASYGFVVDPARRAALLEGLDEIGLTLKREADIAAFQAADRLRRPWVYETG